MVVEGLSARAARCPHCDARASTALRKVVGGAEPVAARVCGNCEYRYPAVSVGHLPMATRLKLGLW